MSSSSQSTMIEMGSFYCCYARRAGLGGRQGWEGGVVSAPPGSGAGVWWEHDVGLCWPRPLEPLQPHLLTEACLCRQTQPSPRSWFVQQKQKLFHEYWMVQQRASVLSLTQEEMPFLNKIMVVIFGCGFHYKCIVALFVGMFGLYGEGLLGCTACLI